MRVKIESDGTSRGTRVVNADTGEELDGVREIEWSWERGYGVRVRLVLDATGADVASDTLGRPLNLELH